LEKETFVKSDGGSYESVFTMAMTVVGVAVVYPVEAWAQSDQFALQSNLDHVWTMIAAGLVFFMQAGFLFLESGLVRSKIPSTSPRRTLPTLSFPR
jgi:hypothetical protein